MHQKVKSLLQRVTKKQLILGVCAAAAVLAAGTGVGVGAAIAAQPAVTQGWVLTVNGVPTAGALTGEELQQSYDALIASYQTENTVETCVLEQVDIVEGEYTVALAQGEGIAAALADAITVQTAYVEEQVAAIAMETVVVEDDSMYEDETVTTEGHDGATVTDTTVICRNGEVFARKQEPAVVTEEMVPTIITNGTKVRPDYVWPCDGGTITSYFGYRNAPTSGASSNHKGLDIGAPYGTDIYSIRQGIVTETGYTSHRGYYVEVTHDNGVVSIYMHCSKILVSEGDSVKMGEHIAEMGSTGVSTGSHLHISILINGENKNPLNFIRG